MSSPSHLCRTLSSELWASSASLPRDGPALSLRRHAVPAALARAPPRVVRRWPSRLPLGGALPFTTALGDIQQDRLAQPGSRGAETGTPAAVCSFHPGTSGAVTASSPQARRPPTEQPWRADPRPRPGPRASVRPAHPSSGARRGRRRRAPGGPGLPARIWQSFSRRSWAAHCRARAPLPGWR